MPFLLDTNAWIFYLKDSSSPIGARLHTTPKSDIRLCSVVKAELLLGAEKYGKPSARIATHHTLFAPFASISFDDASAEVYGRIRHALELSGNVIGPMDLQIAAICLGHNLTLVTNDAGFQSVVGLSTEDWCAP